MDILNGIPWLGTASLLRVSWWKLTLGWDDLVSTSDAGEAGIIFIVLAACMTIALKAGTFLPVASAERDISVSQEVQRSLASVGWGASLLAATGSQLSCVRLRLSTCCRQTRLSIWAMHISARGRKKYVCLPFAPIWRLSHPNNF